MGPKGQHSGVAVGWDRDTTELRQWHRNENTKDWVYFMDTLLRGGDRPALRLRRV